MFDTPIYKRLANNDTGNAAGHQGGIVIPKDLDDYFPDLTGRLTEGVKVPDHELVADLFVNGEFRATVVTRYQYQTWGGSRSPERRLTSELGAIRNVAKGGDFVFFSRSLEDANHYQIELFTEQSSEHQHILDQVGSSRWGTLPSYVAPISNSEIAAALEDEMAREKREFSPFDIGTRAQKETTARRPARDAAFRKKVLPAYNSRCAISGIGTKVSNDVVGLDAAHIVPVEKNGVDDVRNGILLSKDLHWAFDKGLITIDADAGHRVVVSERVKSFVGNDHLSTLHGKSIFLPTDADLRPASSALEWHSQNVFLQNS